MRKVTRDDLKKDLQVTVKFRGHISRVKTDQSGILVGVKLDGVEHWIPFDNVFIWELPVNPSAGPIGPVLPLPKKDNPPTSGEKES